MSAPVQTLTSTTLRGEVQHVIFESGDGTFAVLTIKDANAEEHTVRGALCGLVPGQYLDLAGKWEKHEEYGRQFHAESFKLTLPSTPDGIKRFLSSGVIPGIGEKTAEQIVDFFGTKTLDVLDKAGARLREVPGIGKKKAEAILAGWHASADRRDGMIFLQGLGITPAYCARLYARYGNAAPEIVKTNPYRLADEVNGIGFLRADEIAASLGLKNDSPERLMAGTIFALNQMISAGDVCVPRELLLRNAAELLKVTPELAARALALAMEKNFLKASGDDIYTAALARAEFELPKLVLKIASAQNFSTRRLPPYRPDARFRLSDGQYRAIETVSHYALSIITGGPGVGKTTVVGEIVGRANRAHLDIQLAAPTGRAAKRLSESTHLPAKTIHRLLQFDPATRKFVHGQDNPLSCDLLIVDEISMLDVNLAYFLFRAIRPGTAVVLVGDADQLPSVGPGTVLKSFIECGRFAVTRLTEVFRQGADSRIIVNAHRVNRGEMPEKIGQLPGNALSDFYWIEQDDPEKVLEIIKKLVNERIPARFHFDKFEDIQVLSPMNRGNCGTGIINEALSNLLNGGDKPQLRIGDRVFKAGDKVMQSANNYDKNVFNGDMGRIWQINAKKKTFSVMFDQSRVVEYSPEEAGQLLGAYAITVHKSQGCEFPAVILPLLTQHYMMLQRNLLYTAMTRAKKLLILIGSEKAVRMAVGNTHVVERHTNLTTRLVKDER